MRLSTFIITLVVIVFNLFSTIALAAPTNVDLPITGFSNNPGMSFFDANFVKFLKKWHVPGASIVVMKNGQLITDRGYGWSDKEAGKAITPNSLFRIASVSKTFTAVTILKLVEEGKLSLNDRVFGILNDLKPLNGKTINPQIYQITVQNLLQMSSGWFSSGASHFDPMFGPWPKTVSAILSPELPASCQTTARLMMSMPLRYKPGTHYAYSNLDYCILGLVINKVTGSRYGYKGYESYVQKQVLTPLGIKNMQIGSTQPKYRLSDEARFYRDPNTTSPQELANSAYLPYSDTELLKKNFANGGWLASSKDLGTFIQALQQGQILHPQTLHFMQQKPAFVAKDRATYYTIGGIVYNLNGERYWIQTGSFTGSNALILTKPNGTTIVAIFNYRPEAYVFLARFRPELRRLLINSDL